MRVRHRRRTGRRLAQATAVLATAALAVAACGGGSSDGGGKEQSAPPSNALDSANGVTQLTFWHSMKGKNGAALSAMVARFNAKYNGKIHVTATFQGDYDPALTKYKTAVQQGNTPSVVQVYDIGTRFMVDAKQTISASDLATADGDDGLLNQLEPNIKAYYTVNDKLQSMPFNSSFPLLYINANMFKKAGLDPSNPPKTLDEITAAAKKLTIKSGGKTVQYGFNAAIYGWFLEQLMAQSGDQYCDQDNGRKGLATKVNFADANGVKVAQWYHMMVQNGYAPNTGKKTDDAQAVFKAGKSAMNLESTGTLGGYLDAAKGKFTVAAAPFPKLSSSTADGGTIVGGASLWVDSVGHSDAEKLAAWTFVKFADSATEQASWHTATGYFPVNTGALQQASDKAWVAKNPQFTVAINQLHSEKTSVATSGCALGVMPQSRAASEDGIEKSVLGTDPQTAMTNAANTVTPLIQTYTKQVGG